MLRIVAGTRKSGPDFEATAPLALSTKELGSRGGIVLQISPGGNPSLPAVFNYFLDQAADDDTILFTHDDVWIEDWFLPERLMEGLSQFDVLGVAGNRRRLPKQPSWILKTLEERDDKANFSGAVAHGSNRYSRISRYGPTPRTVKLIDGLFMAAKVRTLRDQGVVFDPQFRFHFYDLDFCRTCEKAGLSIGTWPIAVTHGSGGELGSPDWQAAYRLYLAKWGD